MPQYKKHRGQICLYSGIQHDRVHFFWNIFMSRPHRINYENAYYHVMNRGSGRREIFHDNDDREIFLQTIEEACFQFCIEIHAYCLMGNHYHLLIKTPQANLSRAMRHINGVNPMSRGKWQCISHGNMEIIDYRK